MKNTLFLGGSKGLGLEMAKLALAEGMKVTIMARTALTSPLVQEGRAIGHNIFLDKMGISLEPLHSFAISHVPFDLIVWTAGTYQEGNILDLDPHEIENISRTHFEGPAIALGELLRRNRDELEPCQLVGIASSSSYKVRTGEGLYGSLKAGKAQLIRTLGVELPVLVPGSRVLLVHPGGMNTPFWDGRVQPKLADFMDPAAVADCIWHVIKSQPVGFGEIHIVRQPDRSPRIEYGPRAPEF